MASSFILDGGMIPRSEKRTIDERAELRHPAVSSTAVLEFRGRKHVVRLVNVSTSGAMVIFPHVPNIGERLPLQLLDRGSSRHRCDGSRTAASACPSPPRWSSGGWR